MNFKNALIVFILLALLSIPLVAISQDNLLIIAPDEFIDELEPLKRFKDCSGRPTILLSLTQVYQDYTGRDEPERIKRCIAAYEKSHNIQFVLLVGDGDKFPVRFVCIHKSEPPPEEDPSYNRGFEPADLYYADLYDASGNFDDWDIDNNSLYAERNYYNINKMNLDQVNFYPEIAVGRVPASNSTELTTYVEKIIRYELIIYQQNWFKKALLLVDGGNEPFGDETKKEAITIPYLSGYAITKLYQDSSPYNQMTHQERSAVLNTELNKGAGFVNYLGHGSVVSWAWYHKSHFGGLTNNDRLPVVIAISCQTAQYVVTPPWGDYVDVNGKQWKAWQPKCDLDPDKTCTAIPNPIQSPEDSVWGDSMAEYFLVKSNTGGIGYVGFTSTGNPGYSEEFDEFFFKAYGAYGHHILGDMWRSMMEQYVSKHFSSDGTILSQNLHKHEPKDELFHYNAVLNMLIRTHLFGDPSLVVGGAFTITLSGNVYNGNGGPLQSYSRYRITGNVTVPAGQTLSADSSASILFENGKKITAMDTNPNKGFILNPTPGMSVCLMSMAADPQAEHVVHGMKIHGELKMRNSGEIKLY